METTKDYSRFKASCEEFKTAFNDQFFNTGSIFCHPLLDGVIYTPCTPEEARSDLANACRMSDMLLMSEDGENFKPFKIAEAREIAAANGSVYISDLLGKQAFVALDWMIDGKHDTLIISEEHMRKEGKPYAPVTPLTNVIQPFKKSENKFLYKKGTIEDPVVLSEKNIDEAISAFSDELLSGFPNLETIDGTEFEIFGKKIITDKNEARCMELDKALASIDTFIAEMDKNLSTFEVAGYEYDKKKSVGMFLSKAAAKCGITIDEKALTSLSDVEAMKIELRKLVSDKNSFGFKYAAADSKKTEEAICAIEQSDASADEIKADISALLAARPAMPCIFNLARATSPADAEAVENISEYWNSSAMSPLQIADYLKASYLPEDAIDAEGKIICEGTKASVIADEIKAAAAKYKIKNVPILDELTAYCEDCEKKLRTYNGTLFDTVEEMEKAVKNEKELNDMCSDLSALSKDELIKLRKYIHDMKLDKKTAGKYLLKIKLAMNSCEENQLKMLCTGLTLKKQDELEALIKKLRSDEFDEIIAAPFITQAGDCILRAQLAELTEMFKTIPDKAKADALAKALESGKYDAVFKRHFTAKLNAARDGFARKEIEEIAKGISNADKKALGEITAKLDALTCSNSLKAAARKAVNERSAAIDEQDAAKDFEGIATADKAKLEALRKIVSSGKYKTSITDKYVSQIDKREIEIENSEFIKKCETIPQMDKTALDEITAILESEKYPEDIVSKYLPMVAEREKALIKAELAQMCKDITSMDNAKLDELEKKLSDEKYDKDMTVGYLDTIKGRRKTLINNEADELCKNISNMDKAALAELTEKLKAEKFDQDYNKKHYDAIEKRFNKIETDKLEQMCKDIGKLKKAELEKLSASIAELGFKKENTTPYTDKIRKLEISLMKSEIETLCKNIATTPRKELSKLKEALTSGEFDKELSAKYVEQIDKRTEELIKKELADLCKNIANSPKDKLMSMKLAIAEAPEYTEQGKSYLEQIDNRLRQLDKAEFDKQMASIEKLSMEELEKFTEELENRKSALDAKLYEASVNKCKERMTFLEKQELDKLCSNIAAADVKTLNELKEKISDGKFTPETTFPYIKKLDEAITDRHVKYFTKLTETINNMSRADLIVLLEKIKKNEINSPADMVARYEAKVNAKIKESDANALAAKCKNLSSTSERQSFELIKDINEMDIDPATKKRFITQVELHITDLKTKERDSFAESFKSVMASNSLTGVHFYVPGLSKVFESQYISIKNAYASTEQYELPVLIHEVTQGHVEESYMLTTEALYYKGKDGFDHIKIEQIDRFEAKKGLLSASLNVVEKSGKSSALPNAIDKKLLENAANALNSVLNIIQQGKAAAKLREAEEIKIAEAAKIREKEEEAAALERARKKAEEAEKAAAKTEAVKKEEPKPAPKAPEKVEPIKPIKPISVVVSPIPEVKPIQPITADVKPVEIKTPEVKPAEAKAPEAKPAETKAPEVKPAETKAPEVKPAETKAPEAKSAETKAPEAKPAETKAPEAKSAETKAPEAKPAETKPRVKFCDQCGAKITSDNAKFCMECGNKLIK